MSAVAERAARSMLLAEGAEEATEDRLASTLVDLVRLAGGRVPTWAFEPAALVLVRAGALDGKSLTFGCDYDLHVLSRELRRGYIHAVDSGRLTSDGNEVWLGPLSLSSEEAATAQGGTPLARTIFGLSRDELERRARQLLLAE